MVVVAIITGVAVNDVDVTGMSVTTVVDVAPVDAPPAMRSRKDVAESRSAAPAFAAAPTAAAPALTAAAPAPRAAFAAVAAT
jgi:hypothetical protein